MDSKVDLARDGVPLSDLVRRGELLSADCPSREVLKHVTSRWGVLVLMVLLEQTCRFSDLRRRVDGVSEKMLAQTLQWLAADGFVIRTAYDEVPPHVDYRLTPLGEEVARQVTSLADWIEVNLSRILNARTVDA
ncbi:HxlR-like helix-turn-helix (plasmid) [Caballeronia sp. SBC1]|uniref:winged helix-turn-helix transcriptional regulator n=1 Tax=unclassified Caballeronia TaxID=2646786 RepID=UPI0013E12B82|nr:MULTISPECIES: helix-turn-helix domain-containing protein [unclassified Caballeronia]QIE26090.1 HxlR-like helix-turn-helix [Caballeronia sp. SBC2]QIN64597.1 HxlR-like helix-turn-helix [Caballeronia sp. SBC1]